MIPHSLIDPLALTLVLGGTCAATLLRCGWRESREAVGVILRLLRPRFDAASVRAAMAGYVQRIDTDGLLRAEPRATGDAEIDEVIAALAHDRSTASLAQSFESHRQHRLAASQRAGWVLGQAAELAPVLGLAGTLVALGQLSGIAAEGGQFASAIGSAVSTTLYGLVFANFLFAPLAGAIARQSAAEDAARRAVMDWLAEHANAARPHLGPAPDTKSKAA
ncbi:MAG: MotA/TolQ/ExbB proton channel family protein [Sphingomonadaceae bacterium]|nr:MotA/TolQ/ExbB proton channel family protein [Sphingomonadaceae bacterium]